jgi:hypothetical protein
VAALLGRAAYYDGSDWRRLAGEHSIPAPGELVGDRPIRPRHGELQAKLFSFLKVAGASGPETDQGELLLYLAEIAWFPTAWLSSYLEWERIDARSAKVTLQLSNLKAQAVLHFDDDSRLCSVTAQRYMIHAGRFLLREWSGQLSEYRPIAGMLIPARANVLWCLEAGDFQYFRGQVTEVEYDT